MSVAAFALVIAAQTATSSGSLALQRAFGDRPFTVIADRLEATPRARVFIAEGNVFILRDQLAVRADRVTFDDRRRIAIAEGHVAIVEGESVLFCKRVELALPELIGGIQSAELRIKNKPPPELLDAEALRDFGEDELILSADEVDRTGARTYTIHGGAFTACDCGEDATPTWSIDASSASVDLDSGAWLSWPVFYAKGVPVLVLPAFYVPLGDRRTGLLAPRVGFSRVTGFRVAEPLFITLGESWDTTIEPGFMFDRGATAGLELRWAPSASARGVANLSLLFDQGTPDGIGGWSRDRADPIPRFAIAARHRGHLSEQTKLAAELDLTGDPAYVAELAGPFLARQVESTTSRITITSVSDAGVRVAGGLALIEDLRPATYAGAPDLREVAIFSDDPRGAGLVRQRFAELRIDAPPYPLFVADSPIFGEARLALGAFAAPRPDLARFVRVDLRPAITFPIQLGNVAVLEPQIIGRLTAWAGRSEREDQSATRFGAALKTTLSTELGRRFGVWLHRIRPSLEYVLVPYVEQRGSTAFATSDEIDLFATAHQARAKLASDLFDGSKRVVLLETTFGRDLRGGQNSELVARAELAVGPLTLDGRAAITEDELRELIAGATLANASGDLLSVHYGTFGDRPPEHSLVASEELLPSETIDPRALFWSAFQGVTIAARFSEDLPGDWGRLTLTSGVQLVFDANPDRVRNTETLLRWDSSCDCFGIGAVVTTARDREGVDLAGVVVDLARLGQVAARTE